MFLSSYLKIHHILFASYKLHLFLVSLPSCPIHFHFKKNHLSLIVIMQTKQTSRQNGRHYLWSIYWHLQSARHCPRVTKAITEDSTILEESSGVSWNPHEEYLTQPGGQEKLPRAVSLRTSKCQDRKKGKPGWRHRGGGRMAGGQRSGDHMLSHRGTGPGAHPF